MLRKRARNKRKIPEYLGNRVCGIWPYIIMLLFNAVVHIYIFFTYGQSCQGFIRLFFSFFFFIYPFYYLTDALWSLRPSVCAILSGQLKINRKYYMNTVRREVSEKALLPVTISVPVHTESNEVIFKTLRDSLAAIKRYHQYSGKYANLVVSDDGIAPMLGSPCTKEILSILIHDFNNNPSVLTFKEKKVAERIVFYRENNIGFVVRPAGGRAGLFKKSSNLNYTLRLGKELLNNISMEDLFKPGGPFEGGYAEGDIETQEIILLLDKDSGLKEKIIEAIVPEFATDDKLAYVQCATEAVNLHENYYTFATGHQINNLFHNIWPCKALQGFFVPLVGHNVFLRKSILEKSGLWPEDRASEDYDKAICLYGMGYHGKYAQLSGLEFTEYVSRTFTEETSKQRRYAYGLFEMMFDGTVLTGRARASDKFYMILYFFSLINQVFLLPTVLIECYFGNIHLFWAGFLFTTMCFIVLPMIRGFVMGRYLPEEYSEKLLHTIIIAISFVGHSFSILSAACRYLANKFKENKTPFPSSGVEELEYSFMEGVKLLKDYVHKNPAFFVLSFFCIERIIFMLTRKGIEAVTVIIYTYILFCAVFSPILLSPQLFSGSRNVTSFRKYKRGGVLKKFKEFLFKEMEKEGQCISVWAQKSLIQSPEIIRESAEKNRFDSDISSFLDSYNKMLLESILEKDMPKELILDYHFENCLKKETDGRKELYLLRRKKDNVRALLRITKDYPEEDAVEEANLLRKLNHKGIPKVFTSFEEDGKKYIVREYIEGQSLYEIVNRKGNLSSKDIFGIVEKLTNILSYLHSQSPPVIHRDIKPQNIIVGTDGDIHLIDFGIARRHKEERRQDTSVVLTLDYASPEQYGFEQTTPLSDIYSLGVLMLFLATGRTAKYGLEAQIVNNSLRNLIEGCIAFNPQMRIQSVEEIRDYIKRHRDGDKLSRRRKYKIGVFVASFLVLISAFSYGIGFFAERDKQEKLSFDYGYTIGYTDGYSAVPVFLTNSIILDTEKGNSTGNLAIDGGAFVVESEGMIFYIVDGDIYQMSTKGTDIKLIVKGRNAYALSFYNGWLYYSSGRQIFQTNIYNQESDVLCQNVEGELQVLDGQYFVSKNDGLYSLDLRKGNINLINKFSDYKFLNIEKEGAYFIDRRTGGLFSSNTKNGGLKKIVEKNCKSLCVFDGDIYYSTYDNKSGKILKIDKESGESKILTEVKTEILNVTKDGIYYIDAVDGSIYICSLDGRIRKQVSKNRAIDINIVEDWIFYHNEMDYGRLWCVRPDGANDHPLE